MGYLDLARVVTPRSTKDSRVDVLARAPLFNKGLDFLHGTGHGIGHFGSIHESTIVLYFVLESLRLLIIFDRSNSRRYRQFSGHKI